MDILDILTPELNENQVSELKRRLRDALKTTSQNKSCFDPRIVNLPLPNDAKITYKYGARAYISDIYKGFVWRNGVWYDAKELPADAFKPPASDYFKANGIADYNYNTIYGGIISSMIGINIDDTFYPCILNGQRIFIHENWDSSGPIGVFMFEPLTQQIFRNDSHLCRAHAKNKLTYEDKKNMWYIPVGIKHS
jgi:hypothetical protein